MVRTEYEGDAADWLDELTCNMTSPATRSIGSIDGLSSALRRLGPAGCSGQGFGYSRDYRCRTFLEG